MRIYRVLASVIVLSCVTPASYAQESPVIVLAQGVKVSGIKLHYQPQLKTFYDERHGEPLWTKADGSLTGDAKDVLSMMEESWTHGLNPDNYYVSQLKNTLRGVEAEVVFSSSVAKFGADLSGMRLSPKTLEEDSGSWSRGADPLLLLQHIAQEKKPAEFLRYLAPQDKTYEMLRGELKDIVKDIAKNPQDTWKPVAFPGTIKPGQSHKAILAIRERLNAPAASGSDPLFYDAELVKVVEKFQSRNGLKPDGLIGRRSFAAINQTREQKLIKIIANLERRRWLPKTVPEKYVAVNIPAMQLKAIENNKAVFDIPVIIGRVQRPTMSFADDIIGIRFNPSWYVPDTIKNEDYLPELQKDPHALEKKGIKFRIHTEEGGIQEVASTDIDWTNTTPEQLKSIQMVQGPGDANVLGRIRVLMPNRYDIYLHDTSSPELFAKDDRALSSGCIRLSEPRKIANFVLGKNPSWTEAKLEALLKKDKTIEIPAVKPVPVFLFYFTSWMGEDGNLIIADDLYGLDSKLVYLLKQAGKIPFELKVPAPKMAKR